MLSEDGCVVSVWSLKAHGAGRVERACCVSDTLYTLTSDSRLCATRDGAPVVGFGPSGWVSTTTWQSDLARYERDMLVSSGALEGTRIGAIKLWDAATGKLVQSMTTEGPPIRCLATTTDGGRLASGSSDGLRTWDVLAGKPSSRCELGGDEVRCLRLCGGGGKEARHIVAGDAKGTVWAADPRSPSTTALGAHSGAVEGVATMGPHRLFSVGCCPCARATDDDDDDESLTTTATTRLPPLAARRELRAVLEWDLRRPGGPVATVGWHGDLVLSLEAVDDPSTGEALLVSASRDGGCALWDLQRGPVHEFRVPGTVPTALAVRAGIVVVVSADRIARTYDVGCCSRRAIVRPCGACSGSGRSRLSATATAACMRCAGTGKFAMDDDAMDDDATDGGEPERTPPDQSQETPPTAALSEEEEEEEDESASGHEQQVPRWLSRWLPPDASTQVGHRSKPFRLGDRPFAQALEDHVSGRLEPGDLVILSSSLPIATSAPRQPIFERDTQPALVGDQVGIVVADDLSQVPYRVRGPGGATSWFEAWQLAPCPDERVADGRRDLGEDPSGGDGDGTAPAPAQPSSVDDQETRTTAPPPPPRLAAPGPSQPTTSAAPSMTTTAAATQAAGERSKAVDASLEAFHAQRASRKPASGRLARLRGQAAS